MRRARQGSIRPRRDGMALTILGVAYPFASTSLDAVGGAEQILAILDEAFTSLGHRSLVIASKGSRAAGTLIGFDPPPGPLDENKRAEAHRRYRELIDEAIAEHAPDIVHMHGVDAYSYLPRGGPRVLVTLHLPPSFYPEGSLRDSRRPKTFTNCVSESQRRACPESPAMLDVVPNGIRVEDYGLSDAQGGYTLTLGRICPEKGFHLALDAAKSADVEMCLAGQVFPYEVHERYFRDEIAPRLDEKRRFIGPVDLRTKRALIAQARAVVIASTVPETSSLVAMEALASGVPVIAHRIGALPEIIDDGETGYLVENVDEMAQAMQRAHEIDRRRCRTVAEERFSKGPMVRRYLAHYERILRLSRPG